MEEQAAWACSHCGQIVPDSGVDDGAIHIRCGGRCHLYTGDASQQSLFAPLISPRDFFAACALLGDSCNPDSTISADARAEWSYLQADAMLAARETPDA